MDFLLKISPAKKPSTEIKLEVNSSLIFDYSKLLGWSWKKLEPL